jgi:hypothetical protein
VYCLFVYCVAEFESSIWVTAASLDAAMGLALEVGTAVQEVVMLCRGLSGSDDESLAHPLGPFLSQQTVDTFGSV